MTQGAVPDPNLPRSSTVPEGVDLASARKPDSSARTATPYEDSVNAFSHHSSVIVDLARRNSPDAQAPTVEVRPASDVALLIDTLSQSSRGISAIADALVNLNRLCDASVQRPGKVTLQLAPLIVRSLRENEQGEGLRRASSQPDVELFARVFTNNAPESAQLPGAVRRLLELFDVQQVKGIFPKPMQYLERSPSAKGIYAELRRKILQLEEDRINLSQQQRTADREGGVIDSRREERIDAEFQKLTDGARDLAGRAKDIDLKNNFATNYESIGIAMILKPETVRAVLKFAAELASMLSVLATAEPSQLRALSAPKIPTLSVNSPAGQPEIFALTTRKLPELSIGSEIERTRLIVSVVESALAVRSVLNQFEQQYEQSPARSSSMRILHDEIRIQLGSVFGREADPHLKKILEKIGGGEYADLRTRIYTMPILVLDPRQGTSRQQAFEIPKNMALYRGLVAAVLDSSPTQFQNWKEAFKGTVANSAILLCEEIRRYRAGRDTAGLVTFLDEQLEGESRNISGHVSQTGLLFCLEHLSADTLLASAFKTRLRRKEAVTLLANNMGKALGGRDSEQVAAASAKTISHRLNVSLDDYLGSKAMIAEIQQIFNRNALLFRERHRLDGLPPKLAIMNAFLLYGPPGVGKTHLVNCIANSYGLEILKISREEMERYIKSPKVTARPTGREPSRAELLRTQEPESEEMLANQLAEFMNARIEQLRQKIQKNGTKGGIIFLDEMEAEFFKRDHSGIDRSEVERTNIMLRVIEDAIEKNPEVYFFGATNYLELVDPAALRLGRFGIKFKVDRVDQESAEAIVLNVFERLLLDSERLKDSKLFTQLIANCVGTVPMVVQMAIANEYLTGEMNPNEDADRLMGRFDTNLLLMKKLIGGSEMTTSA